MDMPTFHRATQCTALPQKPLLPDHVVQRARTHALGQRAQGGGVAGQQLVGGGRGTALGHGADQAWNGLPVLSIRIVDAA